MITNEQLTLDIAEFKLLPTEENRNRLKQSIDGIIDKLFNYYWKLTESFECHDRDELARYCIEKSNRYDSNKGKAFNYITTCARCWINQTYRSKRNALVKLGKS